MIKEIFIFTKNDWDGEKMYEYVPQKGNYFTEEEYPGVALRYVLDTGVDKNGNRYCPFCGNSAELIEPPDADRNVIKCSIGHAPMRSIEAWNTRA